MGVAHVGNIETDIFYNIIVSYFIIIVSYFIIIVLHLFSFQIPQFSANRIIICFWNYIAWVVTKKGWRITPPVKSIVMNFSFVVSSEATFALDASSPPPSSILSLDKRQLPFSSPSPKKVLAVGFDSPKRYIMKVTNISIAEWMERCPEQSVAGATGTGSTYAVVLCEMPTQHVTTKRDTYDSPALPSKYW